MMRPNWLTLAASPSFAVMAVVSAAQGASPDAMLCGALQGASPMTGMTAMYVMMGVFHAGPWFGLVGSRFRHRGV